ncbi:MAG TPA: DUF3892 domain-containing protein [Verrucomicrobiae bacterium]|nr:DUF3892 domain-containing protein [Verrucomicrobiae bacterium]
MPQSVEVLCINKTDRFSSHERIRAIGGRNADGSRWKLSEGQAIEAIKQGRYSFYVDRPMGHLAWVVVARSAEGHEYLKTQNDGEQPDNLLSLPECLQ